MEPVSPGKDALFLLDESVEPEDDSLEAEHMPVNVTTMSVLADASVDPFAVTAVLSRQLSVTRQEWLKYTAYQEDPDAPLYTQGSLIKALQTPGNEDMATNSSLFNIDPVPETNRFFNFAKFCFRNRSIFGLPLLKPTSKVSVWQGIVISLLDGTYSAFLVPISIAFSSDLNHWSWTTIVDVIAGFLFTLDIALLFHTGFIITCNLRKRLVMDGYFVARYYAKHASLFIDLLATVPAWVQFLVLVFLKRNTPPLLLVLLNYMRLFRLLRLLRLLKNMFASSSSQLGKRLNAWLSSTFLYIISIIYTAAALINFFGCVWYWVARREGLPNSWLTQVGGDDLSEASQIRQWVVSLYFAMTTVTTVGYGDITAHSAVEQCVATVMMLAGVVFFGILIGSLGEIVQHASTRARQAQMFRRKFEDVEAWMHMRRLPKHTQKRIRNYYAEVWVRHADWKEAEFFEELPAHLRGDVAAFLMEEVFDQSDFFSQLPEGAKTRLAARLSPQMIPPGHDLCQEGDDADCMWILQEGEVMALRHTKEAELLPAPAVIGESVIISDQLPAASIRPCTFRALGSCTVWHLALKDIYTLTHVYPEVLPAMVEAFTDRWEIRLQAMSPDSRQEAQAAGEAIQADSTDGAVPVVRRATADMGTQCMLDNSHSELVIAHTHELRRTHATANTRGPVNNSSVESVGLLGAASAAQQRKAPQGLIQAGDHPTRGGDRPTWQIDRPAWQAESGILTKHAFPVVHHSDLEGAVTEDEASQKQAEATSLLGIDRPHVVSRDHHSPQPARQHPQAVRVSQATHGVSPDDVSISVTTGGHEYLPAGTPASWTDMHQGRASSRQGGPGGAGGPRGAGGGAAGGQSRYDVRSPLHSTHEEHGIRPRSLRPSSTGAPKKFSRQISHSSDFMLSSGGWMAGAFAGKLLHRQHMRRLASSPSMTNKGS